MREDAEGIKEMFAPLNILVTYTRRMQEEDLEIDLNEYEWSPEPLLDASTEETLEEPNDIIDEAQEIIRLKLQREIEEIRLKTQEDDEQQLKEEKAQENSSLTVSLSNEIKKNQMWKYK